MKDLQIRNGIRSTRERLDQLFERPKRQAKTTLKTEALKITKSEQDFYFAEHKIWRPASASPTAPTKIKGQKSRALTSHEIRLSDVKLKHPIKSAPPRRVGAQRPGTARPGRALSEDLDESQVERQWSNFFEDGNDTSDIRDDFELTESSREFGPTESTAVSRPQTSHQSKPKSNDKIADVNIETITSRLKSIQPKTSSSKLEERTYSFERIYTNKSGLGSKSNSSTRLAGKGIASASVESLRNAAARPKSAKPRIVPELRTVMPDQIILDV